MWNVEGLHGRLVLRVEVNKDYMKNVESVETVGCIESIESSVKVDSVGGKNSKGNLEVDGDHWMEHHSVLFVVGLGFYNCYKMEHYHNLLVACSPYNLHVGEDYRINHHNILLVTYKLLDLHIVKEGRIDHYGVLLVNYSLLGPHVGKSCRIGHCSTLFVNYNHFDLHSDRNCRVDRDSLRLVNFAQIDPLVGKVVHNT